MVRAADCKDVTLYEAESDGIKLVQNEFKIGDSRPSHEIFIRKNFKHVENADTEIKIRYSEKNFFLLGSSWLVIRLVYDDKNKLASRNIYVDSTVWLSD